jgi:hypothetical protein
LSIRDIDQIGRFFLFELPGIWPKTFGSNQISDLDGMLPIGSGKRKRRVKVLTISTLHAQVNLSGGVDTDLHAAEVTICGVKFVALAPEFPKGRDRPAALSWRNAECFSGGRGCQGRHESFSENLKSAGGWAVKLV